MKTKIRIGTFETNSSSTHALVFKKKMNKKLTDEERKHASDLVNKALDKMGTLKVQLQEFGWDSDEFYGWKNKLSYVFSYLSVTEDTESLAVDSIRDALSSLVGKDIDIDIEGYGYVDHQSHRIPELLINIAISEPERFLSWLFNDDCAIFTSNDNSEPHFILIPNSLVKPVVEVLLLADKENVFEDVVSIANYDERLNAIENKVDELVKQANLDLSESDMEEIRDIVDSVITDRVYRIRNAMLSDKPKPSGNIVEDMDGQIFIDN
ncbi:MAG: hypothetical protein D6732_24035, partial [Methanobacteriota archaeon]